MSSSKVTRNLSRISKLTAKPRFRSTVSSQAAPVDDENYPKGFYPIYVHNVSKVALERLQKDHSSWVASKSLDSGLHINPNGTFTLSFPAREGFDSGRIWTSYDSSKKQHWLSVYRHKLAVRFLLKDNGQLVDRSGTSDSKRMSSQIHAAVDQMVYAVDQAEAKSLLDHLFLLGRVELNSYNCVVDKFKLVAFQPVEWAMEHDDDYLEEKVTI
eukprot:CAMPEP_0113617050 /NCGR_PEP_ID=MMETSP0017_2-20120614/8567_1 /TAXON_ID=2856 /ORGANISM="Cylindrotheca closterium" /LENGTH=212 /DNA_ID=CAMNT_0000526407 /DNA_START=45 /DNA_END=684 /DNA_ORIENTATION=+ /assembly_acc=CAM_ASM_000147